MGPQVLSKPLQRPVIGGWRGWLVVALLLAASQARAVEVPWLYDVTVPVADQSASARLDAAGRALAELLTRLTGLASVPRNEAVSQALAAPDLYYNQFGFVRREGEDQPGLALELQFVPQAVLNLIREANLPIWRANRPQVMVWLVLDDGSERRILASGSDHPAVEALRERARERGLPLQLPLMDLTDQLSVQPAAVWGRLSQVLMPASQRYGADVVLIGRVRALPDERWAADWELWVEGDYVSVEREAAEPEALGRLAADLAADELAGRYAVLDRGVRRLDLIVSDVQGAGDYADLLRYLGGLEFVEQVSVNAAAGDRLGISLFTAASREQLMELFRLDQRLTAPPEPALAGTTLELVWQPR